MKIGHCEVPERSRAWFTKQKKLCSSQPPFWQKWADRAQNSLNVEFGPDRLRFAGLIPERLIFRHKKSIQVRLISAYIYICTAVGTWQHTAGVSTGNYFVSGIVSPIDLYYAITSIVNAVKGAAEQCASSVPFSSSSSQHLNHYE